MSHTPTCGTPVELAMLNPVLLMFDLRRTIGCCRSLPVELMRRARDSLVTGRDQGVTGATDR
jgi:hypothetical protein